VHARGNRLTGSFRTNARNRSLVFDVAAAFATVIHVSN
jgi:hypothetical protein